MKESEEGIVEEKKKAFGFDFLGLISGASMIAAMFFPWWYFKMDMNFVPTIIYPYLIDGPMSQFVGYKRSPTMTIFNHCINCLYFVNYCWKFYEKKDRTYIFAFVRSHYFIGSLAIDGPYR